MSTNIGLNETLAGTASSVANIPFEFDILRILVVLLAAMVTSSVSEAISWFLLYRKESYKINKSKF